MNASKIKAILVPHAGYDYSGAVASGVYQNLKDYHFDRVVILAPSHHVNFSGIALPGIEYFWYKSPLGLMQLDKNLLKKLSLASSLFVCHHQVHELEHAIEVQIPFIQKYCGSCKIVPLLVGDLNFDQVHQTAEILAKFCDTKTLIVVSSDFTHFGKNFGFVPFDHDILVNIFKLDSMAVKNICNADLQGFQNFLENTGATICGKNPILILLAMLQKKYLGEVASYVIGYDTSAAGELNPEHSVSYVGMVISQQMKDQLPLQDRLTEYEKQFLLQLARTRLQQVVQNPDDRQNSDQYFPGILTPALGEFRGAFVSLYAKDDVRNSKTLRGCIGLLIADQPLYQTVWEMTKSAALFDTRFMPVQMHELSKLSISISVLTQPKKVSSYHDIRLGIDGVILHHGNAQAVFLPEVALEQGWNLEQTLSALSQKAGLSAHAWRDAQTTFELFQAIEIAEHYHN